MSEIPERRVLFLVVKGLSPDRLVELRRTVEADASRQTEMLTLTEENGEEALEKIFAADAVSVWGPMG